MAEITALALLLVTAETQQPLVVVTRDLSNKFDCYEHFATLNTLTKLIDSSLVTFDDLVVLMRVNRVKLGKQAN